MYKLDQAMRKLSSVASSVRAVRNLYRTQPLTAQAAVLGLEAQLTEALEAVRSCRMEVLPGNAEKA